MTDTHLSDIRFDDLQINDKVKQGIADTGFEFCTPIQAISLPLALQGKDISGQAQTGTGKTAAFLIASLHHLLKQEPVQTKAKNPIRGLVLAPTRELAIQIFEDGKPLVKHTGLKMSIAYGGTDYEKQRKDIEQGTDILVGTPGRIIDYFKQKVFSLEALEVIVLDEADRMFDLGFIADIRYLFRRMPPPEQRLNMLFSATLSHRVAELAYEHMSEPEIVKIESETITADKVKEIAYMPSNEEKLPLLLGLIKNANDERTVVFINTKHHAEIIEAWLLENDFKVALLSGDVPQKKREKLLNNFKEGKCNILVATDVAARGLHIPSVNYVINYDLPNDAEDYVHRIGRTARAGESGTAISLICETYAMNIVDIEEFIEHTIPVDRDISEILMTDLKRPDLSNLRSNKKNKKFGARSSKKLSSKGKGPKKLASNKPESKKPEPKNSAPGKLKQEDKKISVKANKPVKSLEDSSQAKDSGKQTETAQTKPQSSSPQPVSHLPQKGKRGNDIPAIG